MWTTIKGGWVAIRLALALYQNSHSRLFRLRLQHSEACKGGGAVGIHWRRRKEVGVVEEEEEEGVVVFHRVTRLTLHSLP
jgi:hypothetical protein